MPAIDVYNPMYIEWLGELVNKHREQCFYLILEKDLTKKLKK